MSHPPNADRRATASSSDEHGAEARALVATAFEVESRTGVLTLSGERYVLARPDLVVGIQKQLEQTVGASTKGFLYLAGEKSADARLDLVRALGGSPDASEGFASNARRIADVLALAGWGRYEILAHERETGTLRIALENSAIAEAYGTSARPVCHLVAGWLASFGKRLMGRDLLCEEVACKAQGRLRCEFVLSPMPSHLR
jgi:hypothetical protein